MSQLSFFFNPAGVAVIGASADARKLSHGVLHNCFSHGYTGRVYPVNPRVQEILGLPCYPDISHVPDPVELAVLMTPAAQCPAVLAACGRRGIKAAIVISGGFAEVGAAGAALEADLLHVARHHGIRLIGPNCVGTLDAHTGLNTTFIRTMPKPGPIAFVSQSGAICGGILEWTAGKGMGFSRFATLGNAADVNETDLLEELADDPNTRVIVAYIEAIREGQRFIECAQRITRHKPILVIKAGRTAAGTRAVSSHTGSLAGVHAAYDAAFRQAGVIQVDTVEQLFNAAHVLAYGPLPRGPRVAVITNAGGPASLAADALELSGLHMPPTSAATVAALRGFTHPEAQLANPVDMLGGAEPAQYEQAAAALLADDAVDALLPILVPQALVNPVAVAEALCAASDAIAPRVKPIVACFMGDEVVQEPIRLLNAHGIAAFVFPEQAAHALGALWQHSSRLLKPASIRQEQDHGEPQLPFAAYRLPAGALGEWEARPVLAACNIPQPRAELARSATEAARLADAAGGYPVALKIVSPDILHKSEVGGVMLHLANAAAVEAAFAAITARVGAQQPAARIEGALVSAMAPAGYELIVGMRRDAQFGPLVMVGLGGIYVELLADVAFRVAPFSRTEAAALLAETHAGKLLQGLRGQPAGDIPALLDVIERVAQLALAQPRLQELDINPLIVYPHGQGVLAVDVRMVVTAD